MAVEAAFALASLVSGLGQLQQGAYNQEVAEQQARSARQAYQYNRQIRADQFEEIESGNLARTLASGVELQGSPLAQRVKNRYNFLQEENTLRFNTETQAQQAEARGELARFKGVAGFGTSLLQSGAILSDSPLLNKKETE